MRKYEGTLIHKESDDLGPIEIVDDSLHRSLHFGTDSRQSSMLLRDPLQLSLSYTRAMCTALLFNENPQRILMLGLGGGSLAKFFLHYFPDCHIDAVEFRPAVHTIAQEYFSLPDDPRLTLHYEDAGSFVRNSARKDEYDLILVDAFLDRGIAYSVCGMNFFEVCHSLLNASGTLSMNLWSDDRIQARDFLDDMGHSFGKDVLKLPVEGKANIIAIASRQAGAKKRLRKLESRAQHLEQQTGVEFISLLKALNKTNRSFF